MIGAVVAEILSSQVVRLGGKHMQTNGMPIWELNISTPTAPIIKKIILWGL